MIRTFPKPGRIFTASHASMRDDFEITTEQIDLIADIAVRAGALGARMTGGGFGGCVIALVPVERTELVGEAGAAGRGRCRFRAAPRHPDPRGRGRRPVRVSEPKTYAVRQFC